MLLIALKVRQPAIFLAAMVSHLVGDVFLIQWNVLKID